MRKLMEVGLLALMTATCLTGTARPELTTASTPCPITFASPLFVPLSGDLRDILIDDTCTHVYISHSDAGRIEVFSLEDQVLGPPISVGSRPAGIDTTPDGSTMYVANSGSYDLSVVDLANNVEVRRIPVPPSYIVPDGPFSIAIANNGKALFSTTFVDSGFGARMMELDLNTDLVVHRTDFWNPLTQGWTTEATFLDASGDRSRVAIVAGDISSGPVFMYTAATNSFSPEEDMNHSLDDIAINGDGSRLLVTGGNVLDANLNLIGSIGCCGGSGVAIDQAGLLGYTAYGPDVYSLDLASFTTRDVLSLGDTAYNGAVYNSIGKMGLSADGSLLAVITDHGFSLVSVTSPATPTPTPPPAVGGTVDLERDPSAPSAEAAGSPAPPYAALASGVAAAFAVLGGAWCARRRWLG